MTLRIAAALVVAVLALAACEDDGASVRDLGGSASSGSGSASGTGHASGSGSATGVASGSGTHASGKDCPQASDETAVRVVLDEFSVTVEGERLSSGPVTVAADNAGEVPHELVVVRAPSVESLPVDDEGVDVEALEPGRLLTETPHVPPGESCVAELDLEPGSYVFFCNVFDGGRSHFLEGMRTRVKVS